MTSSVALGIVYEDVEKLIFKTIHEFLSRYGGDFDELKSRANVAFMQAHRTHDASKGAFSTWLRFNLWHAFLDDIRGNCNRNRRLEPASLELLPARDFSWRRFALELSDDAQTVLRLIFDDDAPRIIVKEADNRGGKPKDIRTTLRDYLSGMGWTAQQVSDAFREIKEALR